MLEAASAGTNAEVEAAGGVGLAAVKLLPMLTAATTTNSPTSSPPRPWRRFGSDFWGRRSRRHILPGRWCASRWRSSDFPPSGSRSWGTPAAPGHRSRRSNGSGPPPRAVVPVSVSTLPWTSRLSLSGGAQTARQPSHSTWNGQETFLFLSYRLFPPPSTVPRRFSLTRSWLSSIIKLIGMKGFRGRCPAAEAVPV